MLSGICRRHVGCSSCLWEPLYLNKTEWHVWKWSTAVPYFNVHMSAYRGESGMAAFVVCVTTTTFFICRTELHIHLFTSIIVHATIYSEQHFMTCLVTFFQHIQLEKHKLTCCRIWIGWKCIETIVYLILWLGCAFYCQYSSIHHFN